MECIKYINDLTIEISILEDIKNNCNDILKNNEITNTLNIKKEQLEDYKNKLNKLSNNQICYRLYSKILNGESLTKAVESVAEENYLNNIKPNSVSAIWRYYKKMKKYLE